MKLFDFGDKKIYYLAVFFVGFLLFLTLNLSEWVRRGISYYTDPVAYWAGYSAKSVNNFMADIKSLPSLQKEYNDLILENGSLKAENAKFKLLEKKVESLEKSTSVLTENDQVLMSEIMIKYLGDNKNYIILSVGKKDGIKNGQTVFWQDNFIGIVSQAQYSTARVNLPSHEKSLLKVRVFNDKGDFIDGVVRGSSSGLLLENISNSFQLTKGQNVVIYDEKVESQLVLGEVSSVEEDVTKATKSGLVSPFVNYRKLNYVFVILE